MMMMMMMMIIMMMLMIIVLMMIMMIVILVVMTDQQYKTNIGPTVTICHAHLLQNLVSKIITLKIQPCV